MRTSARLACLLFPLLLGCDSTFLGEAEPDFNNPFTRGTSYALQEPALQQVAAVTASQRHPGVLYMLDSGAGARLLATDEAGESLGEVRLTGVLRSGWQDLGLQDGRVLVLQTGPVNGRILRFPEPSSPPPFDTEVAEEDSMSFTLPDAAVSSCSGLGVTDMQTAIWLLCGNRLYQLQPSFGGNGVQTAAAAGGLSLKFDLGTLRDLSLSPGGQFVLLSGTERALTAQAASAEDPQWASQLSDKASLVEWPESFPAPEGGSFAFNSVLLYIVAPQMPQGQMFAIFNP